MDDQRAQQITQQIEAVAQQRLATLLGQYIIQSISTQARADAFASELDALATKLAEMQQAPQEQTGLDDVNGQLA